MRFLLLLLIPALSFAQNGLVTIKLKNIPSVIGFWSLNGNSIVDSNFLGTTNSKDLVFKTKNTEAMRIDTNGNVGIGVVSPTTKIDVLGEVKITRDNSDNFLTLKNLSSETVGEITNLGDASFISQYGDGTARTQYRAGLITYNSVNQLIFLETNISTGLNLGIGISSPDTATAKLHVNGTTRLEGTPQSTTSDSLLTIDVQGNVAWRTPYYYGTDTLTNGVDTVWTSDVTANSNIQLTSNGLNGSTQSGHLDVTIISAGNYFVVNSLKSNTTVETGDQRKYYWFFIRKP